MLQQSYPANLHMRMLAAICATSSASQEGVSWDAMQAWGAGDIESLPVIVQRAIYFSLLHCIPITGAFHNV